MATFMTGPPSTAARFAHSLMPSLISGIACVITGITVVVLWIVASSVNFGTFLPDWFDGYLGAEYTNNVVRPILVFINQPVVNTVVLLLGWGLLGLIVYGLLETAVRTRRTWKEARSNVQIPAPGIILYPDKRQWFGVFMLRGSVTLAILVAVAVILPQMGHALGTLAPRIVTGEADIMQSLPRLSLLAGGWILFAHFWVVAIRLLLLRPRIY
jgi:hypothetical protein